MKESKKKKLEAAGWKVGSAASFLGLTEEEEMLVNMKLALANKVKEERQRKKITQEQLAKMIGSSQSRVAKLETPDREISMDLLIRALAALGVSRAQIGKVVGSSPMKRTLQKKPLAATAKTKNREKVPG